MARSSCVDPWRGGARSRGEWKPKRLTVIEFPSRARAKEFYASREFQEIVGLPLRSAKTNLVLVEEPLAQV